MIKVGNTILSDDIATARFACDISRCGGACCVVGDAGAPVSARELPVLRKAWKTLKGELSPEAHDAVERDGLVQGSEEKGYELSCVDSGACVFVTRDEEGAARCAIQKAWQEGRFGWEKPISCHLFPVRLKRIAGFDYANFEYVPRLCSAACEKGEAEGTWLSDFLEEPLVRRYGRDWYRDFQAACRERRESESQGSAA